MLLRTFQRLSRVDRLLADGVLTGEWDGVPPTMRQPYLAMLAAMERAGVATGGRPPVWGWRGRLRLLDAAMLFDPEHELRLGFATVEFEAPADQVVDSDYGRWNDFLAASMAGRPSDWEPGAPTAGDGPVQVCLPCLRAEWVRDIRALPTAGWGELDLTAAA